MECHEQCRGAESARPVMTVSSQPVSRCAATFVLDSRHISTRTAARSTRLGRSPARHDDLDQHAHARDASARAVPLGDVRALPNARRVPRAAHVGPPFGRALPAALRQVRPDVDRAAAQGAHGGQASDRDWSVLSRRGVAAFPFAGELMLQRR